MSSVTDNSSLSGKVVEYDTYIDRQIAKTSLHVKLVDLVSGLVLLGLVLLGSLLVLVIIDHWIVGLNVWARALSLAFIVLVSLIVLGVKVAPALLRSINPAYAAQTLERAFPGLKNGLVNLLFFRERRDAVRGGIYRGMERQAAAGLAQVPIDSAVDRGQIIRWGYGLVAVVAVWCAYILFSPKNPFQTISRVITPWREIARPSQVDILAVSPGDADIFRGQMVDVSAEIADLKDGQLPLIEFSTQDGQIVAQQLPMAASAVPGRYQGVLSSGDHGIQQDLVYRVVAGDAVSRLFQVTASLAPHIVVDRLQYDFPAYTERPGEMVQGEGDIVAIEGTTVTIFGKANQPIRSGHIELISQPAPGASDEDTPVSKTAPLTVRGDQSEFKFRLRLDGDRIRSVYSGYRLHFVNEDQVPSQHPITHSIEVIPDLRPVVKILSPPDRTVKIPENGWQRIEMRALDPDYQLTSLQLAVRTRTQELLREELVSEPRSGQVVTTFDFVPATYGLKSGDVVQYEGVAEDNRHAPLTGQPEPNQTISSKQYFRITPADPSAEREPRPEEQAAADERNQEQDPTSKQPTGNESPPEPRTAADDPSQPPSGKGQDQTQNAEGQDQTQDGEGQDQAQDGEGQAQTRNGEGQQEAGDQQVSPQADSGDKSGLRQNGDNGGEQERQELDSGQAGDAGSKGEGASKAGGDQPSEGGAKGQPPKTSPPRGEQQAASDSASPGEQDRDARGGRPDEPLESDGTRDGEVVERIQEYLRENSELDPKSKDDVSGDEAPGESNGKTRPDDGTADGTVKDDTRPSDTVSQDDATLSDEKAEPGEPAPTSPESGNASDDLAEKDGGAKPNDLASSEKPANDQTGSKPSRTEGQGDQPPNERSPNPDAAADGQPQPRDDAAGKSANGSASDKPGDPGTKGDRHTDAADQADQPGPSPSDGQTPPATPQSKPEPSTSTPDAAAESEQRGEQQQPQSTGAKQTETKSQPGSGEPTSDQAQTKDANPSNMEQEHGEPSAASKGNPAAKGARPGPASAGGAEDEFGGATGDDANLEHAKQATDMVLEYLREQQQQSTDSKLLEKLGWSRDDVAKFLKRWDQLQEKAKVESGKRELNDVLRSMGLQPRRGTTKQETRQDDQLRGNRESGRRVKPPSDVVDQYRAFLRSLQQTEGQ